MNRSTIFGGVMAVALTACGGGGGGGSAPPPAGSGSTPPVTPVTVDVTASGVITGFSSVFVNHDRYEVDGTTVVAIEGESETSGDDSALRVGMKVRIRATDSDGERVAERIEYDDDLKGPATDVNPSADDPSIGSFVVLRQSVIVDMNTVFDNDVGDNNSDGLVDIRDLTLINGRVVVEVSGLPIADGFLATRIDRVNSAAGVPGVDDDEYEVKGFVDEVAEDGLSFRINGATFVIVEGAGGTEFDSGLAPDQTLVGQFVEVKADEDANGNLIAVRVEAEDDFDDENNDGVIDNDDRNGRFEVEGILSSIDTQVSPAVVIVGGVTLEVTDATVLAGLQGTLIELKGTFNDDGILVIDEAHPEVENNVRIEDLIAEVGTTTITTRLGVIVTPTGTSRVEDDASNDDRGDHLTPEQFLQRLQVNDVIRARGFVDANSAVNWTRVERRDDNDMECVLRGAVQSIEGDVATDFTFVVQDVTIDVSQIVNNADFQGSSDQILGRQAFFDALNIGDVVQAKSDDAGLGCEPGRLTARQVEFEADDGVVGSLPDQGGNNTGGAGAREITGTPNNVTETTFVLNNDTVTVVGSTLIDDSIIETALGRETNGLDQRFDQVPAGLTLADLLPGTFSVRVEVSAEGVALRIEDL